MPRELGQDLLNVPMGDMIRQMAFAIADAQLELDDSSIRQAEMMSGKVAIRDAAGDLVFDTNGNITFRDSTVFFGYHKADDKVVPEQVSMMELGFSPTFYQFIDTLIEVKIEIKITEDTESSEAEKGYRRTYSWNRRRRSLSMTVTPVDARHSQKYSYSAEGASVLRTKLVPVPPPAVLEDRARAMLEENQADRQASREQTGV